MFVNVMSSSDLEGASEFFMTCCVSLSLSPTQEAPRDKSEHYDQTQSSDLAIKDDLFLLSHWWGSVEHGCCCLVSQNTQLTSPFPHGLFIQGSVWFPDVVAAHRMKAPPLRGPSELIIFCHGFLSKSGQFSGGGPVLTALCLLPGWVPQPQP